MLFRSASLLFMTGTGQLCLTPGRRTIYRMDRETQQRYVYYHWVVYTTTHTSPTHIHAYSTVRVFNSLFVHTAQYKYSTCYHIYPTMHIPFYELTAHTHLRSNNSILIIPLQTTPPFLIHLPQQRNLGTVLLVLVVTILNSTLSPS